MPPKNFRVVIWNFQNFGIDTWEKERLGSVAFIVHFMKCFKIDVLLIEECKQAGINAIKLFEASGYVADVVGGTLFNNYRLKYSEYSSNDARIPGSANSEGYIVISKKNLLGRSETDMSVLAAVAGQTPLIDLCLAGMQISAPGIYDEFMFHVSRENTTVARFPVTEATSRNTFHDISVINARRPCQVVLNTSSGPIKIIAYHAPVEEQNPVIGAFCSSCLVDVRQPDDCPNLIVGGDFNMTQTSQYDQGFALYRTNSVMITEGSRGTTTCSNTSLLQPPLTPLDTASGYQLSMVDYRIFAGRTPSINTGATNYCAARDQLFYRFDPSIQALNTSGINSGVIDLVQVLVNDTLGLATAVNNNDYIKGYIQNGLKRLEFPAIVTSNPALVDGLKNINNSTGSNPFPNPLVAATFLRIFMSDHLPLFITFNA